MKMNGISPSIVPLIRVQAGLTQHKSNTGNGRCIWWQINYYNSKLLSHLVFFWGKHFLHRSTNAQRHMAARIFCWITIHCCQISFPTYDKETLLGRKFGYAWPPTIWLNNHWTPVPENKFFAATKQHLKCAKLKVWCRYTCNFGL